MKVLIIDDDPGSAQIVAIFLKQREIDSDRVADSLEAYERLTHFKYDAIIIDHLLSGGDIDGLEFAKLIRNHFKGPIYLISGLAKDDVLKTKEDEKAVTGFIAKSNLAKDIERVFDGI